MRLCCPSKAVACTALPLDVDVVSVPAIGDEDQAGAKEARMVLDYAESQAGMVMFEYQDCLRKSDRSKAVMSVGFKVEGWPLNGNGLCKS